MALAILRIAVVFFFLVFGQYKVFGTALVRSGFHDYVDGFIRDGHIRSGCPFSDGS